MLVKHRDIKRINAGKGNLIKIRKYRRIAGIKGTVENILRVERRRMEERRKLQHIRYKFD